MALRTISYDSIQKPCLISFAPMLLSTCMVFGYTGSPRPWYLCVHAFIIQPTFTGYLPYTGYTTVKSINLQFSFTADFSLAISQPRVLSSQEVLEGKNPTNNIVILSLLSKRPVETHGILPYYHAHLFFFHFVFYFVLSILSLWSSICLVSGSSFFTFPFHPFPH